MLQYINVDTQNLQTGALVNQPVTNITVPRSSNVPLTVVFVSGNQQIDPELLTAEIESVSAASPAVVACSSAHGFSNGDEIELAGVTGNPIPISSSSVSNAAPAITIVSNTNANPKTAIQIISNTNANATLNVVAVSMANPAELTTNIPNGITTGDSVTVAGCGIGGVNGTWIATSTGANKFTVLYDNSGGSIGTGGTVVDNTTAASARATIVTTAAAHGITTGDTVSISGNVGSTPSINSSFIATVGSTTTITIPVSTTNGGAGGTIVDVTTTPTTSPTQITTSSAHGITTGDTVIIAGNTGSTPTINGTFIATKIDNYNFTIPVATIVGGSGGTVIDATTAPTNNPTTITTAIPHGFTTGDIVTIGGHTGSTPTLNAPWIATVIGANAFTIPVNVTTAGIGGNATNAITTPTINGIRTITYIDEYSFSVTVHTTAGGANGTASRITPLNLRFTTKDNNQFNEVSIPAEVAAGGFIKSGYGNTAQWTGQLNLITEKLNIDLGIDPTGASPGITQATLMAEYAWQGANPSKINWVPFVVKNDIYKGTETTPVYTGGAIGKTAIPNGQDYVTVVFSPPLSSANWHFLGNPTIANTADTDPPAILATELTARSATGFTMQLSAPTPTGNYAAEWVIAID